MNAIRLIKLIKKLLYALRLKLRTVCFMSVLSLYKGGEVVATMSKVQTTIKMAVHLDSNLVRRLLQITLLTLSTSRWLTQGQKCLNGRVGRPPPTTADVLSILFILYNTILFKNNYIFLDYSFKTVTKVTYFVQVKCFSLLLGYFFHEYTLIVSYILH